jgi:peptide-methionine (S)-S-oxide reductase
MSETATLAGGCFWCLEAVYQEMDGVLRVESGYIGGALDHPTYEQVCSGQTGHAEAVQVEFDPDTTSFREVLDVFFAIHDPTTRDRQGNDVGTQYRSAIFYHSDAQRDQAERVIAELEQEKRWPRPVVTEIKPASRFWPAEEYHRDYFRNHAYQPYCLFTVAPKVKKFRDKFPELRKSPGAG